MVQPAGGNPGLGTAPITSRIIYEQLTIKCELPLAPPALTQLCPCPAPALCPPSASTAPDPFISPGHQVRAS